MKNYRIVAGYYDARIFREEFSEDYEDYKIPDINSLGVYTINQALQLPFISPILERIEDEREEISESLHIGNVLEYLTQEELAKEIEQYIESDDITFAVIFDDLDEAMKYYREQLEKIDEFEREFEFSHLANSREGMVEIWTRNWEK